MTERFKTHELWMHFDNNLVHLVKFNTGEVEYDICLGTGDAAAGGLTQQNLKDIRASFEVFMSELT